MSEPTVFISYSHDNNQHEKWVLKLATDLRQHGVNAILDQWDLRVGSDLRFFMENGLSSTQMVLCVCSEEYVKKVDNGSGGSGYEGMIMTQALLRNAKEEYIIPIVKNNPSLQKVPHAFGSKLYIDFSVEENYVAKYQELLERIYGEDLKKKPPLGKNPFLKELSGKIDLKTRIESVKYHSPEMNGTVKFRYDNNNGVYVIGNGEYSFETRWSRAGNNSVHAYGLIGFKDGEKEFPNLDKLYEYDYSSGSRIIQTGQIVIFRNSYNHFAAIKMGDVKSRNHGSSYDEMVFEYYIYFIETF